VGSQSAYSLLSDPQKRQLYDQFGDTGVQMIDAMAQTGLPRWLFLPAAQRIACGLVSTALVVFVVLLPLSILMRAENEDGWPWVVVLIPLWLLDALYGLALAIRLVAALRGTSRDEAADTHPALGVRPTLIAIGVYLCVVGAQARAPPHAPSRSAARRLTPHCPVVALTQPVTLTSHLSPLTSHLSPLTSHL
jgi:hypothetical protein